MNQSEFSNIKVGDKVFTKYKGHMVKLEINSIYDGCQRKKNVTLKTPNDGKDILRHMYAIYI